MDRQQDEEPLSAAEIQRRFRAGLKGSFKVSHKPLKDQLPTGAPSQSGKRRRKAKAAA